MHTKLYIDQRELFLFLTGLDVETRVGLEWTPLMCALHVTNFDLAKLLLDRGANSNFNKSKK